MEIISEAEFLIFGLDSLFGGKEKIKSSKTITWDLSLIPAHFLCEEL